MNTRTFATLAQVFNIIRKSLLVALLLFVALHSTPAEAQATSPSATATVGPLRIGTGNFTEYNPTHNRIHVGDSVLQAVIGNLQMGTDSSGKECTLDPNQPAPAWSWTYTSTYSTDGTNYGPIGSNGSLSVTGGQTAKLFGTFANGGYFKIKFAGHVTFYTNCKSGPQSLNTSEYEQNFSVDKPDFDFSVSPLAINQGESGVFTSNLTAINGFTGTIGFSNSDNKDTLFGVSGSGTLPTTGTAPITISVASSAKEGDYPVGIRGTGKVGSTTLYHDHTAVVTVTKRGLTLTRKDARGETTDADGTKHGDTIYSYTSSTTAENPPMSNSLIDQVINVQEFHPVFSGTWTLEKSTNYYGVSGSYPSVTYNWSPNHSQDRWDVGYWAVTPEYFTTAGDSFDPYNPPNDVTISPAGSASQTITYTATDKGTQKTVSAHYVLTVHQPVEVGPDTDTRKLYRENPRPAPNSTRFVAVPGNTTGSVYIAKDSSYQLQGGVSLVFGKVWVLKAIDVNVQYSYSVTLSAGAYANVSLPVGYSTYLDLYDVYNYYSGTEKKWDSAGFLGASPWLIKVPDKVPNSVQVHLPYEKMTGGGSSSG